MPAIPVSPVLRVPASSPLPGATLSLVLARRERHRHVTGHHWWAALRFTPNVRRPQGSRRTAPPMPPQPPYASHVAGDLHQRARPCNFSPSSAPSRRASDHAALDHDGTARSQCVQWDHGGCAPRSHRPLSQRPTLKPDEPRADNPSQVRAPRPRREWPHPSPRHLTSPSAVRPLGEFARGRPSIDVCQPGQHWPGLRRDRVQRMNSRPDRPSCLLHRLLSPASPDRHRSKPITRPGSSSSQSQLSPCPNQGVATSLIPSLMSQPPSPTAEPRRGQHLLAHERGTHDLGGPESTKGLAPLRRHNSPSLRPRSWWRETPSLRSSRSMVRVAGLLDIEARGAGRWREQSD